MAEDIYLARDFFYRTTKSSELFSELISFSCCNQPSVKA